MFIRHVAQSGFSRIHDLYPSVRKEFARFVMEFILQPWHLITLFLASYHKREQQRIIEYLRTVKRVYGDAGEGANPVE